MNYGLNFVKYCNKKQVDYFPKFRDHLKQAYENEKMLVVKL